MSGRSARYAWMSRFPRLQPFDSDRKHDGCNGGRGTTRTNDLIHRRIRTQGPNFSEMRPLPYRPNGEISAATTHAYSAMEDTARSNELGCNVSQYHSTTLDQVGGLKVARA